MTNKRVPIVLGSAGVKCAAALELWKTLQSAQIEACMAVGSSRGNLAIPLIFPPWEIDRRLLVVGAVSDPPPVDVAIKEKADTIVAMGFELPMLPEFNQPIGTFDAHMILYVIEQGSKATKEQLAYLSRLLEKG